MPKGKYLTDVPNDHSILIFTAEFRLKLDLELDPEEEDNEIGRNITNCLAKRTVDRRFGIGDQAEDCTRISRGRF